MTETENRARSGRFKLLKFYPSIISNTLKEELTRRKIPYDLAEAYLQQVFVLDRSSQRKYIAFAFANAGDGHEINIPYPAKGTSFKTSIGLNTFTFIEGEDNSKIEIFESMWDFLTWLTMWKLERPKFGSYVLNGNRVMNVLHNINLQRDHIRSVCDFLDNDETGEALRLEIAEAMDELNIRYGAQNYLYSGYNDLSGYWVNDADAVRNWPPKPEEPKGYNGTT